MTDTGPLFVSSGDLIADRRYKWAHRPGRARRFCRRRRHSGADRRACARLCHRLVRARRHPRPARRSRAAPSPRSKKPATPTRRIITAPACSLPGSVPAKPTPAMSESLCAPAVRSICRRVTTRRSPSASPIADRRCCATPSNKRCVRPAGRCVFRRCSISAAAPASPAPPFAPFVERLVGVDLSPAMIAQAESKGLYDRLATAELADFPPDRGRQRREDTISSSPPTSSSM